MKLITMYLRKYRYAIFLNIAIVFCFAFNGYGTTWYISPAGNDVTGDGTIDNPWLTLHKATVTVNIVGDIIHVKAGTYVETEQCVLNVGVSIEGEGDVSVIKSVLTNPFIETLRLSSDEEGIDGNQHISNLKFDGQNLSSYMAIVVNGRSNVSIYNCTIIDFKDRGVIFSGRVDFTNFPPDSIYATGNKFYNNFVNNCAEYGDTTVGIYGRGCLNIGGQVGMLVYNNTIIQNSRPQGQNGWPIKYINDGYLKGCKIYNNILKKIPFGGDHPGDAGWDFCIELFHAQGLEIYNNTIQGSVDLNFSTKGTYPYSVWIHDNTISQDTLNSKYESGIIFEFGTESAIVEHNIINRVSCGVQFNTRDSSIVSDCKIRKNLFSQLAYGAGTGTSGGIMLISEGTQNAIITNLEIDNNTILADTGRAPWVGMHLFSINRGFATNVKIRNNIVIGFEGAWLQGGDTTNMDNVQVLSNNAVNNGHNNLPVWPGGDPVNYNYAGGITIDPLFDSAANFLLLPASPVIDLGVDIGLSYSGTAPDLGYAEFTAPLPVTLTEFNVTENNGKNILQWKTATENNSSHFTVERSGNGQQFKSIGIVNASGFSTSTVNYYFTDTDPLAAINYYRLIMADKDNTVKYSNIISIAAKKGRSLNIANAQLSFGKNNLALNISAAKPQKSTLMLFDNTGRVILSETLFLQKGLNVIDKSSLFLSRGIYYIKLFTEGEVLVKNILSTE
jgi:Right handed beta helix region